jgi:hypothetical protein
LTIRAPEIAAVTRDPALEEREELVQACGLAHDTRREPEDAGAEREHLLGQVREANEKLVTAIVEAQQLADEANAARAAAVQNEERFRSLVYTSSAIVWQASADGRAQVDPDAWRRFTGVDPGQDEWGWLEAVHPKGCRVDHKPRPDDDEAARSGECARLASRSTNASPPVCGSCDSIATLSAAHGESADAVLGIALASHGNLALVRAALRANSVRTPISPMSRAR